MRTPATVIRGVFVSFIVLGVVLISIFNVSESIAVGHPNQDDVSNADLFDTAETPPPLLSVHLPVVLQTGHIELNGAWTNNSEGDRQYGFLPAETRQFVVELDNQTGSEAKVKLTWDIDGPCEQKLMLDGEFDLKPGVSQVKTEDIAPDCLGVTANSIELSYAGETKNFNFNSVVIDPTHVIAATGQGFDNCTLPSVSQMQTWWDSSPYSTVNIYLGGISAACPMNRDAAWLYKVSQQGWSFILTWVGPQAPCTSFNHQMSRDPATARQQGRDNADAAVSTAKRRGFLGDLVIYYDLESFSKGYDDPKCVTAATSFLQGWVEQIHTLGHTAGAYGTPCSSFMSEWAKNNDPPDDVWIADWNSVYEYDPDATVWDTPCIDGPGKPPVWMDHQRLKQYTGGHKETWGGLKITIDSNVLDGQISAILPLPLLQESQPALSSQASTEIIRETEPPISAFQVLTQQEGWILRGENLFWTGDGGASWQDISPTSQGRRQILGVTFLDSQLGWLVSKQDTDDNLGSLSFSQTEDSGRTWQEVSLPVSNPEEVFQIASASLDFVDPQTGWIALKLHSSSNFSLGKLLATEDGGLTWQERTLPLGEPVEFLDGKRGWVAGGPLDQIYYTEDGGGSWNLTETLPQEAAVGMAAANLASLAIDDHPLAGELPQGLVALDMAGDQLGWATVQEGSCTGYKPRAGEVVPQDAQPLICESSSQLMMTDNGGISWQNISPP